MQQFLMEELPIELLVQTCKTAHDARLLHFVRQNKALLPRCEYDCEEKCIVVHVGGCHMTIYSLQYGGLFGERCREEFEELIEKMKQGQPHRMEMQDEAIGIETNGKEIIFYSREADISLPNEVVIPALNQLLATPGDTYSD